MFGAKYLLFSVIITSLQVIILQLISNVIIVTMAMGNGIWPALWTDLVPRDQNTHMLYYYVLFVHPYEMAYVWECIRNLTIAGLLGYRSAVSPEPMRWGRFVGYYTIILHIPRRRKQRVRRTLENCDLGWYIQCWRSKIRFKALVSNMAQN